MTALPAMLPKTRALVAVVRDSNSVPRAAQPCSSTAGSGCRRGYMTSDGLVLSTARTLSCVLPCSESSSGSNSPTLPAPNRSKTARCTVCLSIRYRSLPGTVNADQGILARRPSGTTTRLLAAKTSGGTSASNQAEKAPRASRAEGPSSEARRIRTRSSSSPRRMLLAVSPLVGPDRQRK